MCRKQLQSAWKPEENFISPGVHSRQREVCESRQGQSMCGTNQQLSGCVFLSLYTTVGLFSFPSIHPPVHTQVCHEGHIGQPSSYSSNFLDRMFWDRISTELWVPLLDTLIGQWAAEVCLSLPPVSTPCSWLLGTGRQAISFTNGNTFSDSILFFFISFQSVTRTCLGGGVWNTFK